MDIINFIEMAEGGEMGGSARSAALLMEETEFYFNIRSTIMAEKGRIHEIKHRRDNKPEK